MRRKFSWLVFTQDTLFYRYLYFITWKLHKWKLPMFFISVGLEHLLNGITHYINTHFKPYFDSILCEDFMWKLREKNQVKSVFQDFKPPKYGGHACSSLSETVARRHWKSPASLLQTDEAVLRASWLENDKLDVFLSGYSLFWPWICRVTNMSWITLLVRKSSLNTEIWIQFSRWIIIVTTDQKNWEL